MTVNDVSGSGRPSRVCDVIVVGGGVVARLYVWRLLAAGLRVVWSDPATIHDGPDRDGPRRHASGHGVPRAPFVDARRVALATASLETLAGWGLDLNTAGWHEGVGDHQDTAIRRIEVSRSGALGRCRLQDGVANRDGAVFGRVVPLSAFEALIDQRIAALVEARQAAANAGWLHRVPTLSAAGFEWLGHATTSKGSVTRVRARRVDGIAADEVFEARLVIAADGADSAWRARVGIESDALDHDAVALVGDVNTARPHGGWAYERFTDRGPLALLPAGRQRMNLVWSLQPETAQRLVNDVAAVSDALDREFGRRLGRLTPAQALSAFPLRRVLARAGYARGVLLAGNAWHALHPVAGQGLNLTLRDLAALDAALAKASHPVEWIGDAEALSAWARTRQVDIERTTRATDVLAFAFLAPTATKRKPNVDRFVQQIAPAGDELRAAFLAALARPLGGLLLSGFDRAQRAPASPTPLGRLALRWAGGLPRRVHPWVAQTTPPVSAAQAELGRVISRPVETRHSVIKTEGERSRAMEGDPS